MNIYKPPGSVTLDQHTAKQQIRLGIQGCFNSGKTWSMLTFPNPIVANLDRGLKAHTGRADVVEMKMYDRTVSGGPEKLKDYITRWLDNEAPKLTEEQTLCLDSCTALEISYHIWFKANEHNFLTSQGKVNDFAEWNVKDKFFSEVFNQFKTLRCDVIMTCHEADQPDKAQPGQPAAYSGKIRPLMTGKIKDTMGKDFTDWFRQLCSEKPVDDKLTPEMLSNWKMTKAEFKEMLSTFPGTAFYYWQTTSDNIFDAKCGSLINPPKYLPANFGAMQKYMRPIPTVKP